MVVNSEFVDYSYLEVCGKIFKIYKITEVESLNSFIYFHNQLNSKGCPSTISLDVILDDAESQCSSLQRSFKPHGNKNNGFVIVTPYSTLICLGCVLECYVGFEDYTERQIPITANLKLLVSELVFGDLCELF